MKAHAIRRSVNAGLAVAACSVGLGLAIACSSSSTALPAVTPTPSGRDGGDMVLGPLGLAPGEVAEVSLRDNAAFVRVPTAGGEKFVAIVTSTNLAGSPTRYSATLEEGTDDTGARKLEACSLPPWQGAAPSDDPTPAGSAPKVGDTKILQVAVGAMGAQTITAKAAAVGERAIVWVDATPEHPATMDAAFIDEFLSDFEKTILPRARSLFGMESDLDGNGRIGLVFTPLTKDTAVAFFTGCDLDDLTGCTPGNKGEYLYLTPPADIAPPYNTPAAIKETLAHELGHLIHFNRKVLRNTLSGWPDGAYMIEGFGAFAQDAVGYQAGNLYVALAGLDKIDEFSVGDVFGSRDTYDPKRDGVLRGGAYWLVRYLYDRAGADAVAADGAIENKGGPSFIRAALAAPDAVTEVVRARAGGSLADVTADFYTALLMSGQSKNACFSFAATQVDPLTKKQRGGDPYASFHGQAMKGPATRPIVSADKTLRMGGAEYLTIDVPAGQAELGLRVTVDATAAARVRLARLK